MEISEGFAAEIAGGLGMEFRMDPGVACRVGLGVGLGRGLGARFDMGFGVALGKDRDVKNRWDVEQDVKKRWDVEQCE